MLRIALDVAPGPGGTPLPPVSSGPDNPTGGKTAGATTEAL
jgi:hypothetical protein